MEMLKFVLLIALVRTVCEAAALPSCTWTHFRLKRLNEESTRLLKDMGDPMPLECLEERDHSFPDDVFIKAHDEELVVVALETLKGVSTIFRNNQTSVSWDKEKLNLFRNIIHRQVTNLQECIGEEDQTVMDRSSDSSNATLKSYFEKLEERLKEKEFISCGWEMVRRELQDVLRKFQTFLESKM